MTQRVLLLLALLLLPGCVCSSAKNQAGVTSREHDTYAQLIEQTLAGTIPEKDGKPVTAEELANTPASVKELLQNVITSVYLSRKGWHQLNFAINDGPDPTTLGLDEIPKLE